MPAPPRLFLLLAALLGVAIVLAWNPGDAIPTGLRDALFAQALGLAVLATLLERLLGARTAAPQGSAPMPGAPRAVEITSTVTVAAGVNALWSLLAPPVPRDDPLRHMPRRERVERQLSELSTATLWAEAPAGHAGAVRGRVRDLGEDAGAIARETDGALRVRLEALRDACRAMDDAWTSTPRGKLHELFSDRVAPAVRKALDSQN